MLRPDWPEAGAAREEYQHRQLPALVVDADALGADRAFDIAVDKLQQQRGGTVSTYVVFAVSYITAGNVL